jgi:hypothetical protein
METFACLSVAVLLGRRLPSADAVDDRATRGGNFPSGGGTAPGRTLFRSTTTLEDPLSLSHRQTGQCGTKVSRSQSDKNGIGMSKVARVQEVV